MRAIPRIVIAGTQSGVGKTSLTLGLVTLLRRRGLRVQTFKVGPDYLDPGYLAIASGRTCYNLDGWMMGREHVESLFRQATAGADIAVIEGVMGLFDGASPDSSEGSTAEIARWLQAPVLLVSNAHGMARSFAAQAKGFCSFDPEVHIAGFIANRCGSERHSRWLASSLQAASLPPLVGTILREALPPLGRRHLGLISADKKNVSKKILKSLADALKPGLELEKVIALSMEAPTHSSSSAKSKNFKWPKGRKVRLGIARDEAFHFYYPDNLEVLKQAGCELVFFSPIHDARLPLSLDGIYLGGGYPEEFASELSNNHPMRWKIAAFAIKGGLIYAECGGLMYLSEGIEMLDGNRYPQVGLLPGWVEMSRRRKALGYAEVTLTADCIWGERGRVLRGHEFHYSGRNSEACDLSEWRTVYRLRKRDSISEEAEGFHSKNILASYVHLHWASRPDAVICFVRALRNRSLSNVPQPVPSHA